MFEQSFVCFASVLQIQPEGLNEVSVMSEWLVVEGVNDADWEPKLAFFSLPLISCGYIICVICGLLHEREWMILQEKNWDVWKSPVQEYTLGAL